MSTPAVNALEESGVAFSIHEYSVSEAVGDGYGEAVAVALGVAPERVFKTLMVMVDDVPAVAVIPVGSRLSLKSMARAAGAKKAVMADPADAERLTGYVPGGISALGQRRHHPTFLEASAASFPTVFISAGKRGLQVEVAPEDLVTLTDATPAPLV